MSSGKVERPECKDFVVLGMGLQGPAVAYGLSKLYPNETIFCVELQKARLDRAKWLLGPKRLDVENVHFVQCCEGIPPLEPFLKRKGLTIISTLPNNMNQGIAAECIRRGYRYYDLGGHVQNARRIARLALDADTPVPVFTDLGLAPGLVNVLAESAAGLQSPHGTPVGIHFCCGGLPYGTEEVDNELGYGIVFSPDGLLNEYFNDCEVLSGGEKQFISPMQDDEFVWDGKTLMEMFVTSGGAHTSLDTLKKMGIENAAYYTLRWPGHCKIIRFLKNDIGMTNKQIQELIEKKIPRIRKDVVYIGIDVWYKDNTIDDYRYEILFDDEFTAMQRATGFGAAGLVYATRDIVDRCVLGYEDVDRKKLAVALAELLPEVSIPGLDESANHN